MLVLVLVISLYCSLLFFFSSRRRHTICSLVLEFRRVLFRSLLAHLPAHFGADEGRRRFLDHLLVAALDRAFALVQVKDIAMLVAQYLDFDKIGRAHV